MLIHHILYAYIIGCLHHTMENWLIRGLFYVLRLFVLNNKIDGQGFIDKGADIIGHKRTARCL
jgi:hypothetical protein